MFGGEEEMWGGWSEREKKNNGVNNDFLTLFSLW
jgi:hypothetical protein